MDNFVNIGGKRNNSKRELYLFYSTIISLERVLLTKQNIRILVIIGQRNITFLNAISELIQLQELWIVECGIKDVPFFRENCLLTKLYLYSNEISCISNVEVCSRLTTLFLSGNNICEFKNFGKLISLQELNLADNQLKKINKIFWKRSDLHYLNLAGNNLCSIKDIHNLSQLQKLNSLVFADPLYGDCPLVTLCNYRIYVIHYIPHINKLDHYDICDKERHWINHFFKKQLTYYNVLFHKQLNVHLSLFKYRYEKYKEEINSFKNQLYINKINKDRNCFKGDECREMQNIMLAVELNKKQLIQTREMANMQTRILQQQLITNVRYCGNLSFTEYNATSENTVIQLCKQFLEESLCSVIKDAISIIGLKLYKVIKVNNKEIDHLSFCNNKILQPDGCSMILKILTSPGVTNIKNWPFNFFKTDLLTKEDLTVSNCLAVADADWLNKIFSSMKNENIINLYNVYDKRRVCILIQSPIYNSTKKIQNAKDYLHIKYANYRNESNEICQTFRLSRTDIKNPMFVVEYEYILNELTNVEDECKNCATPCTVVDALYVCLSNCNITQYINVNEALNLHTLIKICISGQNINSIDVDLDLPNLIEFDISFNQLHEFPNANFMKTLKVLNISFNNIQLIHIKHTLSTLEKLDISWNCLIHCLRSIRIFSTFMPNIRKLKICNNPFKDIIDPELIEYITYMYLPKLQLINGSKCKDLNLSKHYFPCAFSMCKLNNKRHHKVLYLKQNMTEQAKLREKRNITQAKYIHISKDHITVYNILQTAINIQELCATCCLLTTFPVVKCLKYLSKLNLGNNFISILDDFTQENLPTLKYLDLTNNLITSLESMGSFYSLQEFYCGNNQIKSLTHIDNLKTWRVLRIIDLYNNPISADTLHRKFLVFHLSNIEYISGEHVQSSDISEARSIFGNKLDEHVLYGIYKIDRLTNITQLSLVDCSLSKVDLSAEFLPQLESLDLSKNQIIYLYGLNSFKYLHTLCLSYNCLKSFNGDGSEKNNYAFPKLCTLLLDHNCIKSVMNVTKQILPVIKHLFLNNNYLENINGVNHCSTLESLILDHNKIEMLSTEDFIEMDSLKLLSVENNKIKSLEFTKPLKKLEKLYVAHNCLMNEIEIQYLLLLKTLEEITFEGNPLYIETYENKIIIPNFELKEIEEV